MHGTVTLASLVEKEGKLAEERPQIAAVFENRLRIGMKLDCDSTTIYAALLDGRYRGAIHRSDLDSDHPYNTYRHAGLPPGPIANPGLASIRAVDAPGRTDALYFVLRPDGSGAHEFSSNIAAHEAAAARFRRARKKVSPSSGGCASISPRSSRPPSPKPCGTICSSGSRRYPRATCASCCAPTGLPFEQPYAGIRQHTFEELEQSLREMLQVYAEAMAAGNRAARPLLPPPGDRRQGPRPLPGAQPARRAGKEGAEGRDGAVDAGLAGEPRSLSRLGGSAKEVPSGCSAGWRPGAPRRRLTAIS